MDLNLYCGAGCRTPDPPYRACLADALRGGAVSESDVDRALRRALLPRFRLGLFDSDRPGGGPWANATARDVDSGAAREAAREAAAAGMVLLRNRAGVLPLRGAGRVAVIGPNADRAAGLVSNYNGCADADGGGELEGCRLVTPLEGIRAAARRRGGEVVYAKGCELDGTDMSGFLEVTEAGLPDESLPEERCLKSACLKSACRKSACPKSACRKSACLKSACPKSACLKSACLKSACLKSDCMKRD